jgi:hypothetical protein
MCRELEAVYEAIIAFAKMSSHLGLQGLTLYEYPYLTILYETDPEVRRYKPGVKMVLLPPPWPYNMWRNEGDEVAMEEAPIRQLWPTDSQRRFFVFNSHCGDIIIKNADAPSLPLDPNW